MVRKQARQAALARVVEECEIGSQAELVAALRERGYKVNQAGVSRDIRELGLAKIGGRYRTFLGSGPSSGNGSTIGDGLITSAEAAGANLIVIRTAPGGAGVVGVQVDRDLAGDVVGTIAGDDTLFVAVRSRAAQGRVLARFGRRARRGE